MHFLFDTGPFGRRQVSACLLCKPITAPLPASGLPKGHGSSYLVLFIILLHIFGGTFNTWYQSMNRVIKSDTTVIVLSVSFSIPVYEVYYLMLIHADLVHSS